MLLFDGDGSLLGQGEGLAVRPIVWSWLLEGVYPEEGQVGGREIEVVDVQPVQFLGLEPVVVLSGVLDELVGEDLRDLCGLVGSRRVDFPLVEIFLWMKLDCEDGVISGFQGRNIGVSAWRDSGGCDSPEVHHEFIIAKTGQFEADLVVEEEDAGLCGELGSQISVEVIVELGTLLELQDIGDVVRPSNRLKNILIKPRSEVTQQLETQTSAPDWINIPLLVLADRILQYKVGILDPAIVNVYLIFSSPSGKEHAIDLPQNDSDV